LRENRNDILSSVPDGGDKDNPLVVKNELSKADDVFIQLAEVFTAIVKNNKTLFFQTLDLGFINYVLDLLTNPQSESETQLSICIFDDIVEFTKEQSQSLYQQFIPNILPFANSSHPGIIQAITYGCGSYVIYGGKEIDSFFEKILNTLITIICKKDSRNKTLASSTENAISSIGKIIQFRYDLLGDKLGELIKGWLSWLPLEDDIGEAKLVHKQLCDLIESNHPHIFGNNFENLPVIFNIFSDIISTQLVKKSTNAQIVDIIKKIQNQNSELANSALNSLPLNKRERILRQLNFNL